MILIKSKSFCQLTSPSPFIFQYMHLGLKGQANKAFFFFKYKKGNSLQLPENSIQCYSLNLLIHIIIIYCISYLFQVAFKIESVAGKVCAHTLSCTYTRDIAAHSNLPQHSFQSHWRLSENCIEVWTYSFLILLTLSAFLSQVSDLCHSLKALSYSLAFTCFILHRYSSPVNPLYV